MPNGWPKLKPRGVTRRHLGGPVRHRTMEVRTTGCDVVPRSGSPRRVPRPRSPMTIRTTALLALLLPLPLPVLAAFAIEAAGPTPPRPETMFRGGPDHRGVYEGGGPTLVGLAWRAPTAGDGSIFAVDAASGTRRWRLTTGPDLPLPWGHESGDHFLSSPAVAGGRVYAGLYDGRVYCFDLTSGTLRWRYETGVSRSSRARTASIAGAFSRRRPSTRPARHRLRSCAGRRTDGDVRGGGREHIGS